ncbi:MAG: alpha-L-fucosidase [Planctomycetota bacterium]|jgi:alpha-L-fucosidase
MKTAAAILLLLGFLVFLCAPSRAQIESPDPPGQTSSKAHGEVDPPEPLEPVPTSRQLAWQKLEYYAFIHFNMNTFTDREWGGGDEDPARFNPTMLDCRQWARVCADAGMEGIILTAKHHDGFCLWPSRLTEHTVASSPWRGGSGDLLRELSEACREFDLKLGIYLSPWDRHEPTYGDSPRYNRHFKSQLTEVLTGYGDVFEVWFDGACGEGPNGKKQVYDWPGYIEVVRKHQPDAVIFSDAGPDIRWVGNERGFADPTNWSLLDRDGFHPGTPRYRELTSGHRDGTHWLPAEADVSIRPGWYYHASQDDHVKSLDALKDIYFHSVGRNANLLLNLPVDRRGLVHENDVKRLEELDAYIFQTFGKERGSTECKHNLAAGCSARADQIRGSRPEYAADRALDSDLETYWAVDDEVSRASLEVVLGLPRLFNVAMVQEPIHLGQRVEKFYIEARTSAGYEKIAEGTTIGYKRLLRFPAVKATKVRLVIEEAKACPLIAELGLFLTPPKVTIEAGSPCFLKSQTVTLRSDLPGAKIYYTRDGTEPSLKSPVYRRPIELTESTLIKAIAVLDGRSSVVPAVAAFIAFDEKDLLPPAAPEGTRRPGLRYTAYEGGWQSLTDMAKVVAAETDSATALQGTAPGFDLTVRPRDEHFALCFEGYTEIPADGIYTFFTRSDDGSRLYIGGRLVVDNDGLHGMAEKQGYIPLRAGLHSLRVEYFNATGGLGLELSFEGPGVERQPPEPIYFDE